MYAHAPMMVVVMTTDGLVLHCNEAASRVTGYAEHELVGRNFWSLLFPGRLFSQVPRFVSAVHLGQIVGKDASLMMRRRDGKECVVAWTRILHEGADGCKAIVCFGTDLTDRLLASDLADQPEAVVGVVGGSGGGGEIDGELVEPLFVLPPALPSDSSVSGTAAVRQVQEFLVEIETRMAALRMALSQNDLADLTTIAAALQDGSQADFSAHADKLCTTAVCDKMDDVSELVRRIVKMCNPSATC